MEQVSLHTGTLTLTPPMHIARCVAKATALLAEQPHLRLKARQIMVELLDGGLVLNGKLPSYFLKQVAQETLRPMGLPISNLIRVQS